MLDAGQGRHPLRPEGGQPGHQEAAGVVGVDHVVDEAPLGRDLRGCRTARRTRPRARGQRRPLHGIVEGGQPAAVQDGHRARRPHDRDLGARPGQADVVAEAPGVHDDVGAAVGLAQHHAEPGDGGGGVGGHQLGTVADDAPPLDVLAGLEARAVDERDERDPEGVAGLHEAGRLARRLDVERAGLVAGLVGDHAHRRAGQAPVAGDHVGGGRGPHLEERVPVDDVADHRAHVVGGGRPVRDGGGRHPAGPVERGRRSGTVGAWSSQLDGR